MSKTFPKVYLECFAHISADSQPFWLKIGPLEKSRVSGPLPVPVPAVTRTPNPQGLRNPCHSLVPIASMVLLQGSRITPFVDPWSTTTIMESKPSDSGRSVIKSIVIKEKGRKGLD